MTNKDKFLKDGVKPEDFAIWLSNALFERRIAVDVQPKAIVDCLVSTSKPQLTEDERVILRNLKTDKYILRDKEGDIILCEEELTKEEIERGLYTGYILDIFNHLFQFIKEGEEYLIEELLGEK